MLIPFLDEAAVLLELALQPGDLLRAEPGRPGLGRQRRRQGNLEAAIRSGRAINYVE